MEFDYNFYWWKELFVDEDGDGYIYLFSARNFFFSFFSSTIPHPSLIPHIPPIPQQIPFLHSKKAQLQTSIFIIDINEISSISNQPPRQNQTTTKNPTSPPPLPFPNISNHHPSPFPPPLSPSIKSRSSHIIYRKENALPKSDISRRQMGLRWWWWSRWAFENC